MEELLTRILRNWDQNFDDVPWGSKAISIAIPETEEFDSFKLMLDTHSPEVAIRPITCNHEENQFLEECKYSIRFDDNSSTYNLTIDADVNIKAIEVTQVHGGSTIGRLACLSRSLATKEWVVTYNSFDREKLLIERIRNLLSKLDDKKAKPLLLFFCALIERNFQIAAANIERDSFWSAKKQLLSPFCAKFAVDFNAHGIKRTFKYWSLDEKISYLKSISEIISVLNESMGNSCLGFGAALGLVRDQDLIPHDDDLDILVALPLEKYPNLPDGLDKVSLLLKKSGFKVEGNFFSHLWVRHPNGYRCDVFIGLIEEMGKLSFYPSPRRCLDISDFLPFSQHSLLSVSLPFPKNINKYLEITYGQNWMTPDNYFQHPWDRSEYKDLDAPRIKPAILTRGELNRSKLGAISSSTK